MRLKKINITLYILTVIFFLNRIDNAPALALTTERDGSVLYTYQSSCESTPSKKEYGIIIPKGNKQVDTIYLYFHGYEASTPQTMCESGGHGLCANAANLKTQGINPAIIVPQGKDNIQADDLSLSSSGKMNCVVDEAKAQLQNLKTAGTLTSVNDTNWIVAGHSDGWSPVYRFLLGYSANKTLLFDACYSTGCESIINSGKTGSIFIYAGDDRQPNYGTLEQAKIVYNNHKSSGIRLVQALKPAFDHYSIRSKCFLDHKNGDLCGGLATLFSDQPIVAPVTPVEALKAELTGRKPILEVNIPGLNFSDVKTLKDDTGTYFYIPWIPELISALYKFLLAIVSIVAAVVIVVQGIRVIGSGGGEGKTTAYKKILQSIIGLFIAWGSYAILYNINPALVQFNALRVKVVEGIPIFETGVPDELATTASAPPSSGKMVSFCPPDPDKKRLEKCKEQCAKWKGSDGKLNFDLMPKEGSGMLPPDSPYLRPSSQWPKMNNISFGGGLKATQPVIDGLLKADAYLSNPSKPHGGKGYRISLSSCWRDYRIEARKQCNYIDQGIDPSSVGNAWPGANPHSSGQACDLTLYDQNKKAMTSDSLTAQGCDKFLPGSKILDEILTDPSVGGRRLVFEQWHYEWGNIDHCRCLNAQDCARYWRPSGVKCAAGPFNIPEPKGC